MTKALWRGTSADYIHGADITITRANIERAQLTRLQDGRTPLTPAELVTLFVHFPRGRHFARAERLMQARPDSAAEKAG